MDKKTVLLEVNTVMDCDDGPKFFPKPKNVASELNRQIAELLGRGRVGDSTQFSYGIGNILQVDLDDGIGLTIGVVRDAVKEVCRIFKDMAGVREDVLAVNDVIIHVSIKAEDRVDAPCTYSSEFMWSADVEALRNIKFED